MLITYFALIVIAIAVLPTGAYRILAVFAFNGKSHFVMNERLAKGLAARGHQIDVISHFPLKKPMPNYNQIADLSGTLPNLVNNLTLDFVQSNFINTPIVRVIATLYGTDLCHFLGRPELQKIIKNPPTDPPYDLVIMEVFGANCYAALGKHLGVPVVGTITAVMFPWSNAAVANPDNPSYIPWAYSGFRSDMNLWERIVNTYQNHWMNWEFNQYTSAQDELIRKYIDPRAPGVQEAAKNISLILVNSHYSLNGVRPFTSAVVEVGGLHIDENEGEISKELAKWLDESKDGFIFFSFGSMLKIESLPEDQLRAIYASVAKLAPVRVLMKVANPDELPAGLPKNVLTSSWIPQVFVLKHKNVRAFVTHGGLMGTQEAIYFGVPLIGVPLFADQAQNVMSYESKGIAVSVDSYHLTEKKLDKAFNAILRDPSYRIAAKKISAEFRDRPMPALDTAIFWIEYVIRHGGTNIRSPAMDLTWWQVALLDVYGILLAVLALAFYVLRLTARALIRTIFGSNNRKLRSKKNN